MAVTPVREDAGGLTCLCEDSCFGERPRRQERLRPTGYVDGSVVLEWGPYAPESWRNGHGTRSDSESDSDSDSEEEEEVPRGAQRWCPLRCCCLLWDGWAEDPELAVFSLV